MKDNKWERRLIDNAKKKVFNNFTEKYCFYTFNFI